MRRLLLTCVALTLLVAAAPAADSGTDRDVTDVAAQLLAEHGDRLGVDAAAFTLDLVRTSPIGTHVRGRQIRDGVPVAETFAAVHLLDDGTVLVDARATDATGEPARGAVLAADAERAALATLGAAQHVVDVATERTLVERGARLHDTFRVTVLAPRVAARVDVDAATGEVVAIDDTRTFADGTASVFDPNPVVTLQDNSLRESGVDVFGVDTDLNDARLTAALVALPIRDVDVPQTVAGRLVGPWVSVQGPAPLPPTLDLAFTRNDPRFETAMAYAHLDRLQRYFQDLGFTDVNAEPQDVYTLPILGFDNSFYLPVGDLIAFGAGGIDDAEDAEVIVHEYGHAVQHAQVPGWGATHEGGAMGEAFGDWLAAAYYAREVSGGFQDACVADWDAVSYSGANPPCLRRTDTQKVYPGDMTNSSVHADGEIWSRFLWDLREALVSDVEIEEQELTPEEAAALRTDRSITLVLAHHELLSPTATFADAVAALRVAATALGHPEYVPLIDAAAQARGLPLTSG
ncbi:MAG: M36 family metallopeptidase [Actinobacteria bacterium]|nr:M36 family metallopeptidase [Actinomycetota bacterium]